MGNPFFDTLPKSEQIVPIQVSQVLNQFRNYLQVSIDALKDKEVFCHWEKLHPKQFELTTKQHLFTLTPNTTIRLQVSQEGWYEIVSEADKTPICDDFAPSLDEPISCGRGAGRYKRNISKEDYQFPKLYLPGLSNTQEKSSEYVVDWTGYRLIIRPLGESFNTLRDVYVSGQRCNVLDVDGSVIKISGYIDDKDTIEINGVEYSFTIVEQISKDVLQKYKAIRKQTKWIVASEQKSLALSNVEIKKRTDIHEYLQPRHLKGKGFQRDQWTIEPTKKNRTWLLIPQDESIPEPPVYLNHREYPSWQFTLEEKQIREKWIQLIESDESEDTGKSELDYFFDDNITIKNKGKLKREYRIIDQRFEERQVLLAFKDTKDRFSKHSVYPTCDELQVRVNIDQLRNQKNAVNRLMCRPSLGHTPLLKLCVSRQHLWSEFAPKDPSTISWKVLTDEGYAGCDKQREFVQKAMVTPDFAILDGPPGTGKTTTILELIMQLVLEGKRVLLSASTHAAINNVLERIQDNDVLRDHIFPLRIGDEAKARDVKQYQYDNLKGELQNAVGDAATSQLLVDSSNLVCGTTIGILRLFREEDVVLDRGEPPFDVMIIDECSKTTFQEFLVPAMYAKRWVLVGDVRQLSPFTDREQIVANLNAIPNMSASLRRALFLLEMLRIDNQNPYAVPMIVPVSKEVLACIHQELEYRPKDVDKILLVGHKNKQLSQVKTYKEMSQDLALWYQRTLIFIEEHALDFYKLTMYFPDDAVVLQDKWLSSPHAFQTYVHAKLQRLFRKNRNRKQSEDQNKWTLGELYEDITKDLDRRSWADEVCWRIERLYWLRLAGEQKQHQSYKRVLERLYPNSIDVKDSIDQIRNLAFPSILEALSGDGLHKKRKHRKTTLNQGFSEQERTCRYTTLTHQHRMHSDISKFPSRQFYKGASLLNGNHVQRVWSYVHYTTRSAWVDVKGKTHNNRNEQEAKKILHDLKRFCDWANQQKETYTVAVLTFYKAQEKVLRERLRSLPKNNQRYSSFEHKGVWIKLATVDYFQGQEADVVFLSMVQTYRDGFMDSPNRLNVAITRARYQLVIVGDQHYFMKKSRSNDLRSLARHHDSQQRKKK